MTLQNCPVTSTSVLPTSTPTNDNMINRQYLKALCGHRAHAAEWDRNTRKQAKNNAVMGMELRAWHMLGKHCAKRALTLTSYFKRLFNGCCCPDQRKSRANVLFQYFSSIHISICTYFSQLFSIICNKHCISFPFIYKVTKIHGIQYLLLVTAHMWGTEKESKHLYT